MIESNRSWLTLLCLLCTIGYGLFCFGPTIHATWFVIDDHEVVGRMGTASRLPFSKILEALNTTEVNLHSDALRYRPLYFGFQFLESATFGKDASLWYAFRVAIFCFFGAVLCWFCSGFLGRFVGLAFTLFELSNIYWAGVFARLGSGEAYGVAGLSLIGVGCCIDQRRMRSFASCALVTVGLIICVGTKENLIPFAALPIAMLVFNRARLSIGAKLVLCAGVAFTCWIAAIVVYRVGHAAHDVYMRDATVSSRGRLIIDFLHSPLVELWLAAFVATLGLWLWLRTKTNYVDRQSRQLRAALLVSAASLCFYFSQYIFYAGDWPNYDSPRYLFPGLLARDLALTYLTVAVIDTMTGDRLRLPVAHAAVSSTNLLRAALALGLAFGAFQRAAENRQQAWSMVAASNEFMKILHDALHGLSDHPGAALVLVAHAPYDYEPIISTSRFFRAFGGTNPITLQVDPDILKRAPEDDAYALSLAHDLSGFQASGHELLAPFSQRFLPDCYSIGFSGVSSSACAKGVAYTPPWEG